jgi:exoribonuclease II
MALENSLVLYKNRPARVVRAGEKLDLELEGGEAAKVRLKDVVLLHPGPLRNLSELRPLHGEVQAAWEILTGTRTTLPELAELIYSSYTPVSAWATWQLVMDGIYFRGSAEEVVALTPEEVARRQAVRAAATAEREAWQDFVGRVRQRHYVEEDVRYLQDVESLALGRAVGSRVLRELGREETPENAHALLLDLGYWGLHVNPYPTRLGLPEAAPALAVPALPEEERADLTGLLAYAIDDEDTDTPDDALSFVPAADGPGGRLWVHVADPAALMPPGSPLDLEARARGSTAHLPEGNVPMVPPEAVRLLGLGLAEVSPALSFALDLDAQGQITAFDVVPSRVRVERLTYEQAEGHLDGPPWTLLQQLIDAHRAGRFAQGAVNLEFPEVKVKLRGGQVELRPLPPLASRTLVEESMIMAGEAVARWAVERDIPLPFATQDPPDTDGANLQPSSYSGMWALRRTLKHSQYRSMPGPHAGLGLTAYAQATSPLRRYLDLVVHQQLRAYLRGQPMLNAQEMLERVGMAEAVLGSIRQADRLAIRHWTLVYLLQEGKWHGEGVLIEKRGLSGTFLIPALALESHEHLPADLPLDSQAEVSLRDVDLPRLDARFRILS